MALSNIRREPRREITESLLGILAVVGFLWVDYLSCSMVNRMFFPKDPCPVPLAMIIFIAASGLVFLLSTGLLYGTHALGEVICDALAERGLDPRPKERR